MYGNPAAKSAVEMAVHDLFAQERKLPLFEVLGGARRQRVPVLWMLAAGERQADVEAARAKAGDGFLAFKVKVGVAKPGDRVAEDLARAADVRAAVATEARVSADANQGYGREEAIRFVRGAKGAGLDFVEQPVRAEDVESMRLAAAAGGAPVGADEGIHSLSDLERHHQLGAAQGASLKIIKLGGLQAVMQTGRRAEELGMSINIAGKIAESSISSAAVVHLAAALPQLNWDASITNQYLLEDVAENPIRVRHGHVSPPLEPGLGVRVDEARVRRFAYRP
jgi:muconate cycloisomerase